MNTMADGIAVARPGDLPFSIIAQAGIEVLTVDDEQIAQAVVMCLERSKLLVRAIRCGRDRGGFADPAAFGPPVVITLSGGNVDPLLLLRIVQRGLVAAGRYVVIAARIPDRRGPSSTCWPGSPR